MEVFDYADKAKKVTIPKTIQMEELSKIGKQAFEGDKTLKSITLKTTKLNKTSVGKNTLKGTNKKLVIKVPGKQVKAYKKYFNKKGNKKVIIKSK